MLANGCHLKRHEWSTAAEAIELHCRNNSFTLAGIQSNRRIQERSLRVVKSRSKS
jgi:GH24 family phage-related lysozyme (muramidase)